MANSFTLNFVCSTATKIGTDELNGYNYKPGMGTKMGDGVVFAYIIEKHAHPISKLHFQKIYYFEVHM